MAFSRQLSSFLEAGIPVLDALEIVAQQTGSPPMRIVITDIHDSIHRGTSFSAAVHAHPDVFPRSIEPCSNPLSTPAISTTVLSQLPEYLEARHRGQAAGEERVDLPDCRARSSPLSQ